MPRSEVPADALRLTPAHPLAAEGGAVRAEWTGAPRTVDLLSDIHLHPADPATAQAWRRHMTETSADAVVILGDLFEAWVGDDSPQDDPFLRDCLQTLQAYARRGDLLVMRGNRDFLFGQGFADQTGAHLLADPCVLVAPGCEPLLCTHGDAWVRDDQAYMAVRSQLRSPAWRQAFLAQPLERRRTAAAAMREASQQHQADPTTVYADIAAADALSALADHASRWLVHGHTHRPVCSQPLDGRTAGDAAGCRWVLPDWDLSAKPPRGGILRWTAQGLAPLDLTDLHLI